MNTTFNFNRFWKVMCNEWFLTRKKILLFWGVAVVIAFGLTALVALSGQGSLIDRNVLLIFCFVAMCLLQGWYLQYYFREFSSKKKTQALFLLPASQSETFWAKFSLGAVLYFLISLVFISAFLLFCGMLNEWLWNNGLSEFWVNALSESDVTAEEHFANRQTLLILAVDGIILQFSTVWLLVMSGFLFGLLLFKKNAVLKSFLFWTAVIIIGGYFICFVYFLFTGVFPNFAILGMTSFDSSKSVSMFHIYPNLSIIMYAFIGLALIAISRVKFNEKTI